MKDSQAAGVQADYVRRVLEAYVELPETRPRWHSSDRQVAESLFQRKVALPVVETALVLGSARRLARDPQRILPPIRCLSYFLGVVEEVLAQPPPAAYIAHLRQTRMAGRRKV